VNRLSQSGLAFLAAGMLAGAGAAMAASTDPVAIPTGQTITPLAAPGAVFQELNPGLSGLPAFSAGQAVSTAVSPDGRTLLVLTSGYNQNYDANGKTIAAQSNEYVFVFGSDRRQCLQPHSVERLDGRSTLPGGTAQGLVRRLTGAACDLSAAAEP
jgi:hypothetical protein